MSPSVTSSSTGLAGAAVLAAAVVGALTGQITLLALALAGGVGVGVGWVVVRNRPSSPVGPAVAWSSGCIALVQVSDTLAASAYTATPLPLAGLVKPLWAGAWPINLFGILLLLLVFPDRHGRRRTWLPYVYLLATAVMVFAMWDARQADGQVAGSEDPVRNVTAAAALITVGTCLVLAVLSLAETYRNGEQRQREQVRWLMLSGIGVVALLMAGWVANAAGVVLDLAYGPFVLGILVFPPLAVGLAIVRHDLFDIDRLLSESTTWLITALVSAVVFALVTMGAAEVLRERTALGSAAAAFVVALGLLPMHRWLSGAVGRVLDRDRYVALAAVQALAVDVSAGRREPEEVEQVLRSAQHDPALRVLLVDPNGTWVTVEGQPTEGADGFTLQTRGEPFARIVLGRDSARARRRIGELARAGWVPIEVCRLRLVLRAALDETAASRARLAQATMVERRRWERDLHDGPQQRLVAVGMRLRLLQRSLTGADATEVDSAVADLQECVAELRRVAHGVRPSQLDDGLAAALAAVQDSCPIPFGLAVEDLPPIDEVRTLTAYLVVAEAVTNALKHADAQRIDVHVGRRDSRVVVTVRDDGIGGVPVDAPLSALRDRVLSVGGSLGIDSPAGRGTTVEAVI